MSCFAKFGRASHDEPIVFGAQRPGYSRQSVEERAVDDWINFMRGEGIRRVVCLLDKEQLNYYSSLPNGLLDFYKQEFGPEMVCHEAICDHHLCDEQKLNRILGFFTKASEVGDKVVVHCSGGSGRTGHVLACWLVHGRGFEGKRALSAVEEMGRGPREAVNCGNATEEDLMQLLASCHR
jgi:protein-tyrosine phosphatase